jgi:YVTN family beta-propeller protein
VSHSNLLKVSAIDPTTGAVVATVSLPFNPTLLAVTPDGAFVYVGSLDNRVWVIQTATNTLVATVPLPELIGVGGLAVTPDGSRVYVVQVSEISVIDTVTNTIVAAVPLEGASYGAIAFTSGSCVRAYVGHFNTVWVLKPAPIDFIMGEVPVGPIPSSIAVSPPPRNLGTWLVRAPMPTSRAHLAAATAVGADGRSRIYAIGGHNAENIALRTVEAYDPTTDTWTTVASMSSPRALLAAATGPDGRIYAIGGQNQNGLELATVEVYDPMTDSWATVASVQFQSHEGVPGRAGHAAASLADGRIYAVGGFASFDPEVSRAVGTPSVEAYDANGDVWSFVAPIPHFGVGRYLLAAAAGPDGRLYGIGGAVRDAVGSELLYSSVTAYDSDSDTWSSVADLLSPRFDLAAATGPDDKIYTIGGMSLTDTGRYLTLDFVDAYDLPTDSWGSCGCLPTSLRSGLAAARGADGRIYVIGGLDHNGHALDTLEAYAPP